MREVRDFDQEFPVKEVEPVTFKLGGEMLTTSRFLHPSIFTKEISGTKGTIEMLQMVLDAPSRATFQALIDDPDRYISFEQIDAAAAWTIRVLSGVPDRPTEPSAQSGPGQDGTNPSSEDASSSVESVATG